MIYAFADYTLDTQRYELRHAGTLCKLEPQALDLLAYLLQHRDRVVPKQELLEQLWPDRFVGDGILTQQMMMVRRAIGDNGRHQHTIKTLHGRGYRFVAAVSVEADAPDYATPPAMPDMPRPPGHVPFPDVPRPSTDSSPVRSQPLASLGHPLPGALEGERKQVTVLCCILAASRHGTALLEPESLYRLMQMCFAEAQQVIQRFEGTMMQQGSDGFMALFGAPVAHEDHARRAVWAAWEIQQRLHAQSRLREALHSAVVSVRVGLHTGLIIAGQSAANPQWLSTAAAGTIAVATQLQHLAAFGTLLMSAATWQLVREEVESEACGSVEVDGVPMAISVYTVRGMAKRRAGVVGHGSRPWRCFVGRVHELAILEERLERVLDGEGQVIGISGAPGLGKSRLLAEFLHRSVRGGPLQYCEGHCLSYGQNTPYLPILDVLRQLCGLLDTDNPEAITSKISHHL